MVDAEAVVFFIKIFLVKQVGYEIHYATKAEASDNILLTKERVLRGVIGVQQNLCYNGRTRYSVEVASRLQIAYRDICNSKASRKRLYYALLTYRKSQTLHTKREF